MEWSGGSDASNAGQVVRRAIRKTVADLSTRMCIRQNTPPTKLKLARRSRFPLKDTRCRNRRSGQQVSTPFNSFPAMKATSGNLSHWYLTLHQQTTRSSRCFTLDGAVQLCGAALGYKVSAFRTSQQKHLLLLRAPISEIHLAATNTARSVV